MSPERRQHLLRLACLLGSLALSAALVFAGLSASQAGGADRPAWAPLQPDEPLGEPGRFLHQRVTVSGEIVRIVGPRAFALRSRSVGQGLLVVLGDQATEGGPRLEVGQQVEVDGTVRLLSRQERQGLQARFGLDLSRDRLPIAYGDRAYVLAGRVRVCSQTSRGGSPPGSDDSSPVRHSVRAQSRRKPRLGPVSAP